MSFDNPGTSDGFADVLRFTKNYQDSGEVGDRIPLFQVGIKQGEKTARFSTDVQPPSNPRVTEDFSSTRLNTNTWYRIEVQQFFDKAQDQV